MVPSLSDFDRTNRPIKANAPPVLRLAKRALRAGRSGEGG